MKPNREFSEIAPEPRVSLTGREGSYLLLDASHPRIQTGILHKGEWSAWEEHTAEAEQSLFCSAENCLKESGLTLQGLAGFLFCEGPGSVLGTRIVAMAIRTWRILATPSPPPVYAYQSLGLLAHFLLAEGEIPPFGVISDARRNHWNLQEVDRSGQLLALRRISSEELENFPAALWKPEERHVSQPLPETVKRIDYSLRACAPLFFEDPLLQQTEEPTPLLLQAPSYTKWEHQPQRRLE